MEGMNMTHAANQLYTVIFFDAPGKWIYRVFDNSTLKTNTRTKNDIVAEGITTSHKSATEQAEQARKDYHS